MRQSLLENEKSVSYSEEDGSYICETNRGRERENRSIHSHGYISGEMDTISDILKKFGYTIKRLKNGNIKLQKIEIE